MSDTSKFIYNNSTGQFRESFDGEDFDQLQDYEVLCKSKPNKSCKKCYGRGYTGRDPIRREYMPCPKCFKKIVDFVHARARVEKQVAKQKKDAEVVEKFDASGE
jgi:hypothetical protein